MALLVKAVTAFLMLKSVYKLQFISRSKLNKTKISNQYTDFLFFIF